MNPIFESILISAVWLWGTKVWLLCICENDFAIYFPVPSWFGRMPIIQKEISECPYLPGLSEMLIPYVVLSGRWLLLGRPITHRRGVHFSPEETGKAAACLKSQFLTDRRNWSIRFPQHSTGFLKSHHIPILPHSTSHHCLKRVFQFRFAHMRHSGKFI